MNTHLPGKTPTSNARRRIVNVEQSPTECRILELHEALARVIQSLIRVPTLPTEHPSIHHTVKAHRILAGLARAATCAGLVGVSARSSLSMIPEFSPVHKTVAAGRYEVDRERKKGSLRAAPRSQRTRLKNTKSALQHRLDAKTLGRAADGLYERP